MLRLSLAVALACTVCCPYTGAARQMRADDKETCLGHPDFGPAICCRNCTDCCSDMNDCNFGDDNTGVGNFGSFNHGDFNLGNSSVGDCNVMDGAWGIGGPEYRGCPLELQDHIIRYCAINPHYKKCGFPPHYFGEEFSGKLRQVVLECDSEIPVQDKSKLRAMLKRREKQKRSLERVKVSKNRPNEAQSR